MARPPRVAAPYAEAIRWMAVNDDNGWLDDAEPVPSVTASLVADLYRRTTDEVIVDLRKVLERITKQK